MKSTVRHPAAASRAPSTAGVWRPARCSVLLAAALACGVAATAQPQGSGSTAAQPPQATQPSQAQAQNYRALRASQVVGMSVRNPQGQDIGKIADMIVDMRTGRARYAILTFDPGILQGERLFAVPTTDLRMAADREDIVYDMRREQLERAAVNPSDWDRTFRDPGYLAALDRTWNVSERSDRAYAQRVSDLLGKEVKDRQGQDIGELEELVVDMRNQQVHYAVVAFDPGWTTPERNYAFPLRSFSLGTGGDELVLDVNRAQVQGMPGFNEDRYANLNERSWVAQVDRGLRGARNADARPAADTAVVRRARADRN
jgi:sporulation protein YlmC with PRC-barrel domain